MDDGYLRLLVDTMAVRPVAGAAAVTSCLDAEKTADALRLILGEWREMSSARANGIKFEAGSLAEIRLN